MTVGVFGACGTFAARRLNESNTLIADCAASCEVEKIPASCVCAAEASVTGDPIRT